MLQTFKERGVSEKKGNRFLLTVILLAVVLTGVSSTASLEQEVHSVYRAADLVSNAPGRAPQTDFRLIDPWGMASDAGGDWLVANSGSGRVTYYSRSGLPLPDLSPIAIVVPVNPSGVYDYSEPRGIVFNDTADFGLAPGVPATLLFTTRDGTIAGWNRDANEYEAALMVDNAPQAVYTGAAITLEREALLYVANFSQGRIETYDTAFSAVQLGGNAFSDPQIPAGYAPFNIKNINNMLFVAYAEYQGAGHAAPGEGAGYVDAFDPEGNLVLRFQHGPWMNAPWGIALAPPGFGDFSGRLLVANTGSGMIAAFDPQTGGFLGYLPGTQGGPLSIPGLHGIGFSSESTGAGAELFYTAGLDGGKNGIMGSISVSAGPGSEEGASETTPGTKY